MAFHSAIKSALSNYTTEVLNRALTGLKDEYSKDMASRDERHATEIKASTERRKNSESSLEKTDGLAKQVSGNLAASTKLAKDQQEALSAKDVESRKANSGDRSQRLGSCFSEESRPLCRTEAYRYDTGYNGDRELARS